MNGTDFFFSVGRGGSAVFYRSAVTAPQIQKNRPPHLERCEILVAFVRGKASFHVLTDNTGNDNDRCYSDARISRSGRTRA